ncbi:unnamed protein product [Arabidopsis lyrata]|uniref:Uncharacterized protein n=1 Tax=Arabidopsis lyrata subsp. lyrata TaxID=81972 RepID=D7KX85_ARALL|nr:uncharacterized protein LOC9323907 [Arabidopsis lyrata subsp. lyrata]EFH64102.1 hypothetical protein ARALYDRAFT_895978 [Arabidopsis lyrata subsp. lyrata]CAH8258815.1 unnamed protein product [Arabidopsis lyrata]|eukprot:XP_002887843.1 uncharacterized protein LOC9323907 [Arabidopsis lyrata subsp. lyrata]
MSTLQQLSVHSTISNVITEKRKSVTIPTNGSHHLESKPTIHDVDKCAEAFIQNFRRQLSLQCDNILPRGSL